MGDFSRFVALHEVRVQRGNREPDIASFRVFREAVERDADLTQFFRLSIGLQGGGDLCAQCRDDGLLVPCPQLRKYDSESGAFLVPARNVCLSGRREEGGYYPLQNAVAIAVVERCHGGEQRQHKECSRAFGPLSLEAKRPQEHRLGQKTCRGNVDRIFQRVTRRPRIAVVCGTVCRVSTITRPWRATAL